MIVQWYLGRFWWPIELQVQNIRSCNDIALIVGAIQRQENLVEQFSTVFLSMAEKFVFDFHITQYQGQFRQGRTKRPGIFISSQDKAHTEQQVVSFVLFIVNNGRARKEVDVMGGQIQYFASQFVRAWNNVFTASFEYGKGGICRLGSFNWVARLSRRYYRGGINSKGFAE